MSDFRPLVKSAFRKSRAIFSSTAGAFAITLSRISLRAPKFFSPFLLESSRLKNSPSSKFLGPIPVSAPASRSAAADSRSQAFVRTASPAASFKSTLAPAFNNALTKYGSLDLAAIISAVSPFWSLSSMQLFVFAISSSAMSSLNFFHSYVMPEHFWDSSISAFAPCRFLTRKPAPRLIKRSAIKILRSFMKRSRGVMPELSAWSIFALRFNSISTSAGLSPS
ncbi:MAG: hypothetical protein ACD_47C00608G0002 [uncultured bacterium]|nr:MAG: hypothetical protein ACD_47C00608G0002 [uncultured bacterium]